MMVILMMMEITKNLPSSLIIVTNVIFNAIDLIISIME